MLQRGKLSLQSFLLVANNEPGKKKPKYFNSEHSIFSVTTQAGHSEWQQIQRRKNVLTLCKRYKLTLHKR